MAEGDPFNPNEISAAAERIKALGLFSDTSVNIIAGDSPSEVIIDVEVVNNQLEHYPLVLVIQLFRLWWFDRIPREEFLGRGQIFLFY